jgi:hypothetical protein
MIRLSPPPAGGDRGQDGDLAGRCGIQPDRLEAMDVLLMARMQFAADITLHIPFATISIASAGS